MSESEPFEATARPTGVAATVTVEPVTCLRCGCLCDDLVVTTQGERVVELGNACELARTWFLQDRTDEASLPVAEIDGLPATMPEAVREVVRRLTGARAPVIAGLAGSTNQTVAAAVRLADRIGAVVDPSSPGSPARNLALARAGRVSATLGEVKNRSDVVVFWGVDPVRTHPRHWERYSVLPRGRFIPEGRAGRTVIVVDEHRTASAEQADQYVPIARMREFEVLWALRGLVKGLDLDADRVTRATGVDWPVLQGLAGALKAARYGALFYSPPAGDKTLAGAAAVIEAAQGLVRELNRHTRFVLQGLGEPGNASGAEAVMTWQTGFPTAVDLAAGYPDSIPLATSASERLRRGESDVVLVVGPAPEFLRSAPVRVATIMIAAPEVDAPDPAEVSIRCRAATPGFDEPGTVVRTDGVALPLRPARGARFPTEGQWLDAIADQFQEMMKT